MHQSLDTEGLTTALTAAGQWRRVEIHHSTGSTNDDALADAQPYTIVAAGEQTAGRGRRGRAWTSPLGTSVSMSMVLPTVALPEGGGSRGAAPSGGAPAVGEPAAPGWVPLAVGLGVRDALQEVLAIAGPRTEQRPGGPVDAQVALKWPNDVLAGRRGEGLGKVGGILCQMTGTNPPLIVAGVGINVSVPKDALPEPAGAAPAATSLHLLTDGVVTREQVVVAVARCVVSRHGQWLSGSDGLEQLRREYVGACSTLGQPIDVHLLSGDVRPGVAVGVGPGGELSVRWKNGDAGYINAGDVVHIRRGEGHD